MDRREALMSLVGLGTGLLHLAGLTKEDNEKPYIHSSPGDWAIGWVDDPKDFWCRKWVGSAKYGNEQDVFVLNARQYRFSLLFRSDSPTQPFSEIMTLNVNVEGQPDSVKIGVPYQYYIEPWMTWINANIDCWRLPVDDNARYQRIYDKDNLKENKLRCPFIDFVTKGCLFENQPQFDLFADKNSDLHKRLWNDPIGRWFLTYFQNWNMYKDHVRYREANEFPTNDSQEKISFLRSIGLIHNFEGKDDAANSNSKL